MAVSSKKTILLVEDYADSREMLKCFLEGLKYHVLEAQNGSQAFELAVNHRPDLILTDFGLPDTDGIELIRRLRKHGDSLANVPIIILTAYDREQYYHRAIEAGCTAFFGKPSDSEGLGSAIDKLIRENCLARENHSRTYPSSD